jgi:hypothetical protein
MTAALVFVLASTLTWLALALADRVWPRRPVELAPSLAPLGVTREMLGDVCLTVEVDHGLYELPGRGPRRYVDAGPKLSVTIDGREMPWSEVAAMVRASGR